MRASTLHTVATQPSAGPETASPRRFAVVLAGSAPTGERSAQRLARSITERGAEVVFLGREERAHEIAAVVAERQADTVELCLGERGGTLLVRQLLRELTAIGRRDVSVVVRKVA